MSDEPTAWEDINPTMALAPRPEPRAPSSERLQPATEEDFAVELTACLALVAPVGMDEAARREWLAVAWETLKHLPADLLAMGCAKARQTADHPAKIVPAIVAATSDWLATRRRVDELDRLQLAPPETERCTPEQAREILQEFGLASKFQSNRYESNQPGSG